MTGSCLTRKRSCSRANDLQGLGLLQKHYQTEILALLAEGLSNKEIGARLHISFGTVRTHLMHIYEKLHVRCRTEAAAKYLRAIPPGASQGVPKT